MSVFLTMSKLGHQSYPAGQRAEARAAYQTLKHAGHAIVYNETRDSNEKLVDISSLHYTTCRACQKKEKHNE